jgi:hypothetical protein
MPTYYCLNCGSTAIVDFEGDDLPKGDEYCSHEFELIEDKPRYPHLNTLLRLIAVDNDMLELPDEEKVWPANVEELELLASKLNEYDKSVFAVGEMTEQDALCEKYGLAKLHDFIDNAFDGELTSNFYRE